MVDFSTPSDKPFERKEGDSVEVALYNRIAAINRINFLVGEKVSGFDLRSKDYVYQYKIDKELWDTFYSDQVDKKIDEEFCQRASDVCLKLEGISESKPECSKIEQSKEDKSIWVETWLKLTSFFSR